ncbi:MAG: TlpA family protein disulfide reductase [Bacteroidia bacterium]|nr:TlpA family protein disulfide reductase [Bacteroidia bacterium]
MKQFIFTKQLFVILLLFFFCFTTHFAQTITGKLSLLINQEIKLEGFNGLKSYSISKSKIDKSGNFQLNYSKLDYGVGCLISSDNKPLYIILSGEDIEINGEALSHTESIKVIKGKQNQWFEKYAKEQPRREQALSAWLYLEKIYSIDSLFLVQKLPTQAIQNEKKRIKNEEQEFVNKIPVDSYVRWFLPTRKLVNSVSIVAQYRPEEIPSTISAFRQLNYTDIRLYKSGLFKDAIESHFWLLENSGRSLDSVFIEMKISIDAMMKTLVKDEKKLNEITDYLFDLLERHSLFQASEYLALKVLNEINCTLNSDLAKQLETYRAMKKGNLAPDIIFYADNSVQSYNISNSQKKLSDIKSKYSVIVFGASWCPKCNEEIPQIAKLYNKWKANEVEVIFISLDEEKEIFQKFVKDFPFISICDFKKWGGAIVKDYYVFGTPTLYLLDSSRKILLRPNSVNQLDAWVDWNLIKGNKDDDKKN